MNRILQFAILIFWGSILYAQNIVIDGVTFSADKKTLIKYPVDKVGEEYVVPEGTEIIAERAFAYNYNLYNIILPTSLDKIEDYAFESCFELSSITWKHFPKSIGKHLFYRSFLLIFYVSESSDNCIVNDGVLFSKDKKTLLCFPNAKNCIEEAYEIPEGTEVISVRAFQDTKIYKKIILPSSLKRIEEEAFYVEERLITNQSGRDYYIENVICNALTPPTVIDDPFVNHCAIKLSVPQESFDIYCNTPYWKDFRSINGSNGNSGIVKNQEDVSKSKVYIKNDVLHLESEKIIEKIEVCSSNGLCIYNECVGGNSLFLEMYRLPKGLLFLQVYTDDELKETFKILNRYE